MAHFYAPFMGAILIYESIFKEAAEIIQKRISILVNERY
jgi:hypothetical protein